jgi:hypothetical protein
MRHVLALFCLLVFPVTGTSQGPTPSFADIRNSGNVFLAKCNADHASSLDELSTHDFCRGYMAGLSDAVELAMMSVTPSCPPERVTPAQMGRIAIKYMHDHPEKTQKMTPILIFESWAAAFPCPAKK